MVLAGSFCCVGVRTSAQQQPLCWRTAWACAYVQLELEFAVAHTAGLRRAVHIGLSALRLNIVLLCVCVLWLQVDPAQVLGGASMNLSQTTLLSLVHQLSANLSPDADAAVKLSWLAEAAPAVDPHDSVTQPHLRSVLTGVMNSLKQLVTALPQSDAMAKQGKITLHLFNSLLHQ
jgi:hypothetical protein